MMVSLNFSPAYPTVQSPTTPGQQSYPGGITDWSRASLTASSSSSDDRLDSSEFHIAA